MIFCAAFALLIGLERLYYYQNGGFRVGKVLSNAPSVCIECNPIEPLLDQTFRLIGSGGTSFVFLGSDGKTILKLFKHQHLNYNPWFLQHLLPGFTDAIRIKRFLRLEKRRYFKRKDFFFQSCLLSQQLETGLIHLCLQPNAQLNREIKLVDAWGFSHAVNLSQTEFALQQRAEPFFPRFKTLGPDEAKEAIDSLIGLIRKRCEQGIGDRDPNLHINFGFVDRRVIEFDLGSYYPKPELCSSQAAAKEAYLATFALREYLAEHSPDLLEYYLRKICVH